MVKNKRYPKFLFLFVQSIVFWGRYKIGVPKYRKDAKRRGKKQKDAKRPGKAQKDAERRKKTAKRPRKLAKRPPKRYYILVSLSRNSLQMYFCIILEKRRIKPYFYLICLFKFNFILNKSSAERSMWAANRPSKL